MENFKPRLFSSNTPRLHTRLTKVFLIPLAVLLCYLQCAGHIPISSSAKRNNLKRGSKERCVRTVICNFGKYSWNPYPGQTNKKTLERIHGIHRRHIVHRFWFVHGRFNCTMIDTSYYD